MRVLCLVERFWPLIGGVEVLTARTLPALCERGYEIEVVTSLEHEGMSPRDEYGGVSIRRLDILRPFKERDLARIASVHEEISELVAEWQPDLIHANFTGPSIFFIPPPRVAPAILSIHGSWPEMRIDREGVLGRKLAAAAWVTACSHSSATDLERRAPWVAGRISVIHNALPEPATEPGPLPFESPVLWCSGRVVEDKGFDLAVRAMPAVVESHPGARLVIAGDGPEREPLRRLADELGVGEHVQLPGWISPDEIETRLASATLAVVPSLLEGFGLVALQAMQLGRPVVASRVGGLPEVVADGETGLLVDVGDVGALTDGILRLLKDERMTQAMGIAARERALGLFSAERHVDAWDHLYQRIAQRRAVGVS